MVLCWMEIGRQAKLDLKKEEQAKLDVKKGDSTAVLRLHGSDFAGSGFV